MRRTWSIGIGLVLVVAALAALAPVAVAAPYTVSVCRTPSGGRAPVSGWSKLNGYGSPHDSCSSGGWFGAAAPSRTSGARAGHYTGYHFDTPAGTTLTGFDAWKTGRACCGGSRNGYSWVTGLFVGSVGRGASQSPWACFSSDGGCVYGDPSRERGYPDTPLDPRNHLAVRGLDAHNLYAVAGCFQGSTDCPADNSPVTELRVFRLDMILDDPSAPAFTTTPTGGLVDGLHPIAGPQTVSFKVSDSGSGVSAAYVLAGGKVVGGAPIGGCSQPYVDPKPCRSSANVALTYDTSGLHDGAHNISIAVTDATGINRSTYGPVRVVTRNAVPGCGSGAGQGAKLAAGWGKRRRRTASIRFGRKGLLHGRLRDVGGNALVGKTVFLLGRSLRAGAPAATLGSTVTKAGGTFHFSVRGLRSRRLRLAFRSGATDIDAACSRPVYEAVRAPVTAKASHRHVSPHGRVTFSGHLRGRPLPKHHRILLALQAWNGHAWQTVQTFRSKASGAYRDAYRFKGGHGKFAFRVLAPRDPTYPFAPGASRSVHVRAG